MQSRTIIGKTTLRSLSSHGNLAFGSIFGSRTLIHVSNKYIASSSEMFKISWRERADLRAFLSFDSTRYDRAALNLTSATRGSASWFIFELYVIDFVLMLRL